MLMAPVVPCMHACMKPEEGGTTVKCFSPCPISQPSAPHPIAAPHPKALNPMAQGWLRSVAKLSDHNPRYGHADSVHPTLSEEEETDDESQAGTVQPGGLGMA